MSGRPVPGYSFSYEVKATIDLAQSGGAYIIYFAASGDALSGPSPEGSYYAIELQNPVVTPGACSANLVVYKRVNSVITMLWSSAVSCRGRAEAQRPILRAIRRMSGGIYVLDEWNNQLVGISDGDLPYTGPGVGARETPVDESYPGNGIARVELGPLDNIGPYPVDRYQVTHTYSGGCLYLDWVPVVDNPDGTGVRVYYVYRNGQEIARPSTSNLTDCAVTAGQSYTYRFSAVDFHASVATPTDVVVTAGPGPPPNPPHYVPPDPVRVGVRSTGAYWGAAPEQIDTRSGNLNFTVPLLRAMGRGGWGVPFALSYNSQVWFKEGAGQTKLGADVGYGFGWKLLAGALTPIWDSYNLVYYLFTDSSGAEYRLDVNENGVWRSSQGVYVYYDSNTGRLNFTDGSFWQMNSVSSMNEQDAGTSYPTLMRDSNGNEVRLEYAQGIGGVGANTSARVVTIEDVRAIQMYYTGPWRTYTFSYNTDAIPHLISIASHISAWTKENWTFGYLANQSLTTPFSPPQSAGTAYLLASLTGGPTGRTQWFEYAGGAGELSQVTLPFGGTLRYTHRTADYSTSRSVREVQYRYLRKSPGAAETSISFQHDDGGDTGRGFHAWTRLVEDIGTFQNVWTFGQTPGVPSYGLLTRYDENTGAAAALRRREFTWWQDSVGVTYLGSALTTLDPGQSYQKQSKTEQWLDRWGNVTETRVYDYGNLSTPARTIQNSYLSGSQYDSRWIRNRLTSRTVNGMQVESNVYDSYGGYARLYPANRTGSPSNDPRQHDNVNFGESFYWRGNPTERYGSGVTVWVSYDTTGSVYGTRDGAGGTNTQDVTTSTNYAAPSRLTPNGMDSLAVNLGYTGWLGLSSATGPNGVIGWTNYDSLGRPTQTYSPYDESPNADYKTGYTYGGNPATQTATTAGRWTRTTLDGLGRPVKVEGGDGSGTKSIVDTEYDRCPCSPLGKVKRVSLPYAPGGTVYWTTYTYDSLGRTLSVTLPNSTGVTTYLYQGNLVRATDPSGRWKKNYHDVFGNIAQVVEPNPAGGEVTTTYTYNALNQVTRVEMPRAGYTQVRTFTYGASSGRLYSKTEPEAGTTSYAYNWDGTLASRTDARNQTVTYTYDGNKRMTSKNGTTLYYYDTNPFGTSENTMGRLAAVEYEGIRESYGYTRGGRMKWKRLTMPGNGAVLAASWQWDNEGRMARVTYPLNEADYTYSYDTMGRLSGMVNYQTGETVVSGAQYNVAGQMTSLSYMGVSEARQYNTRLQLTRITASGYQMPAVDLEYRYSATANDGRVTQMKDWAMGEEVNYSYDSLARLSAAWTTGPEWGQAYSYDGWGNLTGKSVTKGSAPTFGAAYDGATNRQVGGVYDANGNAYRSYYTSYDAENRMVSTDYGEIRTIKYDAMNRRVMVQEYGGADGDLQAEEVTFYGPGGERMGVYRRSIWHDPYSIGAFGGQQAQVWFGGKLIQASGQRVVQDRLGTVTVQGTERMRFWPYGEERGTGAQKRQKWATYWRDESGVDYAMARYQLNGRFLSPDPYIGSGGPRVPQSWNRYAYVQNDPVNYVDPKGLKRHCVGPSDDVTCYEDDDDPSDGLPDGIRDGDEMDDPPQTPDPGGGGGGGGGLLHVGNPRKEGVEYLKVQDAFARMMAFLDADCASFLNSGGGNVGSYVSDLFAHDLLAVGEFDASKAAFTGSLGSDLPEGFASMTFNTTSAFFNSSRSVNNGRIKGGTAKAQVFIILHELGHGLSAQGFRPDLNDAGAGKSNDDLIDSRCKKTLAGIR